MRKPAADSTRACCTKTYHVHTALTYVNNRLHIGHAYELTLASVLTEYLKAWHNAKLIAGTDDHGWKIEAAAKALNVQPVKLANANTNKALATITKLSIPISD